MAWVIDCSLALAWGLPDERSQLADEFFDVMPMASPLWVPSLWWIELANGLSMGKKRKRINEEQYYRLIRAYETLPVQTDAQSGSDFVDSLQQISSDYDLSCYDAAYLELALRRQVGLATLDRHLARMASRAGVSAIFPA